MHCVKKCVIAPDSLSRKKILFFNDCGNNDVWDFYRNNEDKYSYRTSEVKLLLLGASENRCAFCSRTIYDATSLTYSNIPNIFTIEHKVPKNKAPRCIFDWNNMIPCCSTCNNCRGDKEYDESLYIDPCTDYEFENYISFSYDGSIYCLNPAYIKRVNYMINLYNLNGSSKRNNIKNERKRFYRFLIDDDYQKMVKLNEKFGLSDNIILFKDMFLFNERNT